MKTKLGITCTKTQLKNGFQSFLKKYKDVKDKLNSSGFGVDPSIDKDLEEGKVEIGNSFI